MSTNTSPVPPVPAHVPPHLIRDFDFRAGLGDRPHEVIGRLHEVGPIFYSRTHCHAGLGVGTWVLTRAEDISAVLRNPVTFSSRNLTGRASGAGISRLLPLEADPPEHASYRRMLDPRFVASRMGALDDVMRERVNALIDGFVGKGGCEFINDFGDPFPSAMFVSLMGLPHDETRQFMEWERAMMGADGDVARAASLDATGYLRALAERRRSDPKDDLMSFVVAGMIGDRSINDDEIAGIALMLFVGGLDTVTANLAWMFRYLAENPAVQKQLANDPALVPQACEELLRVFSPVLVSRFVTEDTEIRGLALKEGDNVTLSMTLANRDPHVFDDPAQVSFERKPNRHYAFGSGPHNCLGSHLARRECKVAIAEWLRRIPSFEIAPDARITAHGGVVLALDQLPLQWRR